MSETNLKKPGHLHNAYSMGKAQEYPQDKSLTERMRDMSQAERKTVLAAAAKTLIGYYRTDPEIQDWQALDEEDFYDLIE